MTKIDWTKWSAIAEIFSAIAIVLTLLYLADQTSQLSAQTEQNNVLLEAQARANREEVRRWAIGRKLENQHLAQALLKLQNGDELTEFDNFYLDLEVDASFMDWQNIHREFRAGLLEEAVMPVEAWKRIFQNNPRFRENWTPQRRESLEPEFLKWMEDNIVDE